MNRLVRLYQLWSWLPHFRAVAETEHLPTASEALGLSPSALSRALKQLESAVGRDLFVRDGRTIRLNGDGQELLAAVRLAMRGIDDALSRLGSSQVPLPLRIAAPGPYHRAIIMDVAAEIARRHPRVRIELSSTESNEVITSLCRGLIDVCIHEKPVTHSELESVHLLDDPKTVACGMSHPLAKREDVGVAELLAHPFAAPPMSPEGVCGDGWPQDLQRDVTLTVTHMQMGIDACVSGRYLVVLPLTVVRSAKFRALSIEKITLPTAPLYATTRTQLDTQPVEFVQFLDLIKQSLAVHCV